MQDGIVRFAGIASRALHLVGITAANLATKRAAATAVGFTGLFGYLSTVLSGWGLGKLVEQEGWNAGFLAYYC